MGVAQRCDEKAIDYGIIVGQRVASIWPSRHGTSQTNVSIPSNNLLPVPNDVDAADIACIMAFYLPAFQVLHHGQRNELRYSKLRFCDMRILITGGATQLVKSIIRLAKYGGARDIFVIAPKEEHILLNQIENVTTLSEDREEWFPTIDAEMDLIIDCSFPKDFQFIRLALAPKGRLICYPTWDARPGTSKSSSEFDYLLEFCQLCTMKRACIFDLQQSAEDSREELEDDLEFLLYLLDKRKIRPVFTRYKNPNDIIRRAGQSSQRRVDALVFEPVTAKRIF